MIDTWRLRLTQANIGRSVLGGLLLGVGLALALLPLPWLVLAVLGTTFLVATLVRPQLALYLLVFAVPFGSLLSTRVAGIAAGVTEGLLALLAAAWIARLVAQRQRISWPRLSGPLAVFIGAALLSLLQATALPFALKELAKWLEVLGVMLIVVNAITIEKSYGIVAALLLAGLGQALLGIYQFFTRSGPEFFMLMGRFMRAYGTFEQPNPFAGYLGLVAPLGLALGLTLLEPEDRSRAGVEPGRQATVPAWLKWLGLVTFVATVAAIGMSWSRGAWLGLLCALVIVNVVRSRKGAMLFAALVVLVAGTGLLSTFRMLPQSIEQRLTSFVPFIGLRDVRSIQVTDDNYASIERLAHWQAALDMWGSHPWLGVGFGNYETAYASYALPKWPLALGHAHNYYLNVAAETGLIGLVAYLVWWGAALWQAVQAIRRSSDPYIRALALGTLGVLVHVTVHNVVDNLWVHGMYIHVAILLGLIQIPVQQRSTDV